VTQTIQSRYDWFLERLRAHGSRVITRGPSTAIAQCPAHRDRTPSLAVSTGDQAVVLTCHSGCNPQDVMAALTLTYGDLWPDDGVTRIETPAVWIAYAEAVRNINERAKHRDTTKAELPENTTREHVTAYWYVNEHDELVGVKNRFNVIDRDTGEIVGKTFTLHAVVDGEQRPTLEGQHLPLYRLVDTIKAVEVRAPIYLVEGEKDADNLAAHGLAATSLPGGANDPLRPDVLAPLTGADVHIIVDNDPPGHKLAHRLNDALTAIGCRTWYWTAATGKDATDHLDAGLTIHDLIEYRLETGTDDQPDPEVDTVTEPDTDLELPPVPDSTWLPRLLSDLIVEAGAAPEPTILARTDGKLGLYPGRVNGLLGEAESGKTWIALAACREVIKAGGTITYLDFEDSITGIAHRLATLDITGDDLKRVQYINPDTAIHELERQLMLNAIHAHGPALIVADGVNAGMTLLGLDINSNNDATTFFTRILKPLATTGAAVLAIDHLPKSKENRGKGAIGAQAKRAMMTGACYTVKVEDHPAPGQEGKLLLYVDKDRPGRIREQARGKKALWGIAIITSHTPKVAIRIEPPSPDGQDDDDDETPRPPARKALTVKELAKLIHQHRYHDHDHDGQHRPTSVTQIRQQLRDDGHSASNDHTSRAIHHLEVLGCIDNRHRYLKPYPADETTT